jgi:hypothetical protein
MSKPGEILFSVSFKHLSSDAKKAGADLPDSQLYHVSVKQIRALLESMANLAPTVAFPAEPEMRMTGPAGKFVVQIKAGNLNFVSWSTSTRAGGKLTPEQIVAAITGAEADEESAAAPEPSGIRHKLTMAMLIVAIAGVNAFTIWFVSRPPRTLLPKYTLMQAGPAERLLTDVAGVYETGGSSGDRRLEIGKDGAVERVKFGAKREVTQKQQFTVQAAEAAGKPALLTSKKALITIKDPLSVVLYGDTYQRVTR